jgi:hypothetical protein
MAKSTHLTRYLLDMVLPTLGIIHLLPYHQDTIHIRLILAVLVVLPTHTMLFQCPLPALEVHSLLRHHNPLLHTTNIPQDIGLRNRHLPMPTVLILILHLLPITKLTCTILLPIPTTHTIECTII